MQYLFDKCLLTLQGPIEAICIQAGAKSAGLVSLFRRIGKECENIYRPYRWRGLLVLNIDTRGSIVLTLNGEREKETHTFTHASSNLLIEVNSRFGWAGIISHS